MSPDKVVGEIKMRKSEKYDVRRIVRISKPVTGKEIVDALKKLASAKNRKLKKEKNKVGLPSHD